jgi:hypothetical protein
VSWLVLLRPVREAMPFEPTEAEERIVSAEIRPLRIAVR